MKGVFDRWSQTSPVTNHRYGWVTDRPSVNTALFRDYVATDYHLWCVAHRMHLVCQKAYEMLKSADSNFVGILNGNEGDSHADLICLEVKVRQIVTHFRMSPQATIRFDDSCRERGNSVLRFLAECPTRWTGRYYSWKRILDQRTALENYTRLMSSSEIPSQHKEGKWLSEHVLTLSQWTILETIVPLLNAFVTVIERLSATGPTIGLVYPLLKRLRNVTLKPLLNDSSMTVAAKSAFLQSLNDYFSLISHPRVANGKLIVSVNHHHEKVLLLGWLFDPSQFSSDFLVGDPLQELLSVVHQVGERVLFKSIDVSGYVLTDNAINQLQAGTAIQLGALGLRLQPTVTYSQRVAFELDLYLSKLVTIERSQNGVEKLKSFNVLEWWYEHRFEFPELYRLSLVTLSLPAAATSCERFFSICGMTTTNRRSRLLLSTCRKLWFARTLFKPYGPEEMPFLNAYIMHREKK